MHPADLFVGLHASDANAFWLDRETHAEDRFSVIGASGRVLAEADFSWLAENLSEQ